MAIIDGRRNFTVLLFTKLRADLVFVSAASILYLTGVLDAKEAFSGFSSTSVVVIGVLFVVVAGLTYTGVLQWNVKNLLGTPDSYSRAVTRLITVSRRRNKQSGALPSQTRAIVLKAKNRTTSATLPVFMRAGAVQDTPKWCYYGATDLAPGCVSKMVRLHAAIG